MRINLAAETVTGAPATVTIEVDPAVLAAIRAAAGGADFTKTLTGYTKEELDAAFDRVKRPGDWRGAIIAEVPDSEADITRCAIQFFHGDTPTMIRLGDGHTRIIGKGYSAW